MSNISVLIPVEGVLTQGADLKTAMPVKLARALYDGVRSQFRTVALTRADQGIARWWLKREQMHGWSAVLSWNQAMTWPAWKVDTVRDFLANGWEIAAYLDSDVEVARQVQEMGALVLIVGYPAHHLGWQPQDQPIRSWGSVVDTLEAKA